MTIEIGGLKFQLSSRTVPPTSKFKCLAVLDILAGKTETFSLTQTKLRARLLLSTAWYNLLDTLGPADLRALLSDETLHMIHDQDSQNKFRSARTILDHAA